MLYEQAVARRPGLLVDIEKPEPMLNYNILLNHIDAIFDQDIDAMPALSHPGYGLLRKIGVPDFEIHFQQAAHQNIHHHRNSCRADRLLRNQSEPNYIATQSISFSFFAPCV
jgi:hypothetical protein